MRQKLFSVIAFLIYILQLNAQTVNYNLTNSVTKKGYIPYSIEAEFLSCNNVVLKNHLEYNNERWKLDYIQNTENGDYIFYHQVTDVLKYNEFGQLEYPDLHIILISKDKQKINIYTKIKDDYNPYAAGHANPEMIKEISAKKDKNLFRTYFSAVDAHFAKQTKLKELSNLLVNNKLRIDSLSSNDVNDIFIYLKNNSQSLKNGYGKALIEYSITCLKIKDLPLTIKLEIIDFLNQQIVGYVIVISQNSEAKYNSDYWNSTIQEKPRRNDAIVKLINNASYTLKDGKNTIPVVSIDADKCFSYYNTNKNNITENELNEFIVLFDKNNQIVKSSHVLFELLKRNSNEQNNNKLINFLSKMPDDIFKYVIDYNTAQIEKLSESYINNDSLSAKYPKMLIDHKQYQLALNFLDKAKVSPQNKYLKFICFTKVNGTLKGIDYLMSEKPRAKVVNGILLEMGKKMSSDSIIITTKYLFKNYRTALDSIDLTSLSNHGSRIKNITTSDYKWITKVYKELNKQEEAYLIEETYWFSKSLSLDEIALYVNKKEMEPTIASSILFHSGQNCIEEAFRPGGAGVDRERGKNECVKLLLKAAEYDPNDGSIYKLLGDAWAFIGDANKKEFYYNKAEAKGASMKDRQSPGKGNGPRKKNGTLDMRYNSNK